MSRSLAFLVPLLGLLAALPANAASTRTHVSNAGSDANTASSCDYAHPCRTFAAALTVTTPGGEILAIDSSGYGKVVIDRSVAIIAAPGVFAGIGVGAGGNATGVEIATAGVEVVLRGLTITGQGGTYGVNMSNGSSLLVENCTVGGFPAAWTGAINLAGTIRARITGTTVTDSWGGIVLHDGVTATVSGVRLVGIQEVGVWVNPLSTGTTIATIHDTVSSGGNVGFNARPDGASATARMYITQSVATGGGYGVFVGGPGTTEVSIGNSLLSGNGTGVANGASVPTSRKTVLTGNTITFNGIGISNLNGTIRTLGNNTVTDNTTNTTGSPLVTAAPM